MNKKSLDQEIQILKTDFPKLSELSNEYLFTIVCLKYFYRSGEISISDFKDCFVDGKNDGGIDLIDVNDAGNYSSTLSLIQSKFVESLANKQDIVDIFTKMLQTYNNFNLGKTNAYNSRLKKIFKDKLDFVEDQDHIIEFALFVSVDISNERKEEIKSIISTNIGDTIPFLI